MYSALRGACIDIILPVALPIMNSIDGRRHLCTAEPQAGNPKMPCRAVMTSGLSMPVSRFTE